MKFWLPFVFWEKIVTESIYIYWLTLLEQSIVEGIKLSSLDYRIPINQFSIYHYTSQRDESWVIKVNNLFFLQWSIRLNVRTISFTTRKPTKHHHQKAICKTFNFEETTTGCTAWGVLVLFQLIEELNEFVVFKTENIALAWGCREILTWITYLNLLWSQLY